MRGLNVNMGLGSWRLRAEFLKLLGRPHLQQDYLGSLEAFPRATITWYHLMLGFDSDEKL